MLSGWIPLSIVSGVAVAVEILIIKTLTKKNKDEDVDVYSFCFRAYSIGFMALWLLWNYVTKEREKREAVCTAMCNSNNLFPLVCAGLMSAIGVFAYYRATKVAPMTGLPPAIRLIYIVLVFFGGFIFLGEKVSDVKWFGWIAIAMLIIGAALLAISSK